MATPMVSILPVVSSALQVAFHDFSIHLARPFVANSTVGTSTVVATITTVGIGNMGLKLNFCYVVQEVQAAATLPSS